MCAGGQSSFYGIKFEMHYLGMQGHLVYVAVAMAEPLAGGKRKPLLELLVD